MDLAIAANKA